MMGYVDKAYDNAKEENKQSLTKIRKHLRKDPIHFDNEHVGLSLHAQIEDKDFGAETIE